MTGIIFSQCQASLCQWIFDLCERGDKQRRGQKRQETKRVFGIRHFHLASPWWLVCGSGECAQARLFLVKWGYHIWWRRLARQEFFFRNEGISGEWAEWTQHFSPQEPHWSPIYHRNKNKPPFVKRKRAGQIILFDSCLRASQVGKGPSFSLECGPCLSVPQWVVRSREMSYG